MKRLVSEKGAAGVEYAFMLGLAVFLMAALTYDNDGASVYQLAFEDVAIGYTGGTGGVD